MSIQKTGFEKADRYAEALQELQAEADRPRGFEPSEIAARAAALDPTYMAARRFMNRVLGQVGIDRSDAPERAPRLMYGKAETSASLKLLKSAGVIESGVVAPPGANLLGPPEEDPDARPIYRLVPPETGEAEGDARPMFRPAQVLHDPFELTRHLRDPSGPHLM